MGARLLKRRLLFPLRDVKRINARLQAVAVLFEDNRLREGLRELLGEVYDLERLNSRVVLGSANPRDLIAIRNSLARLPAIKSLCSEIAEGVLRQIGLELDELPETLSLLESSIRDDAPVSLREGKIIKAGFHAELDELMTILRDGKGMILALESKERERTGIANLKIGFNKVFGYYLEVSRGQLANVPDYFIRKQTLVNAERYITPELKEFENKTRFLGLMKRGLNWSTRYSLKSEIRLLLRAEFCWQQQPTLPAWTISPAWRRQPGVIATLNRM